MSTRATILGTACVLGMALAAVPASAATLTGFAGDLTSSYGKINPNNSDTVQSWLLGGNVAGPLSDLANLNFQFGAAYNHRWADDFSQEVWNLGGNVFWANNDGRIGLNVDYDTVTHSGHQTNYGAFGEWYFGNFTGMAKGGWLSSGGAAVGGHGNYIGVALAAYFVPDLDITAGVDWAQNLSGRGCQVCGRTGIDRTAFEISAEYLFLEDYGLSGFFEYAHQSDRQNHVDFNDDAFRVGLRWYFGAGNLIGHHRNGTLNPWLPGLGAAGR